MRCFLGSWNFFSLKYKLVLYSVSSYSKTSKTLPNRRNPKKITSLSYPKPQNKNTLWEAKLCINVNCPGGEDGKGDYGIGLMRLKF